MNTRKKKLEALAESFIIGQMLDHDHQQVLSHNPRARKDCRVGVYDLKKQQLVVPTEFGNAHMFAPGFYLVRKGDKVGIFSESAQRLVIPVECAEIDLPNKDGIFSMKKVKTTTQWHSLKKLRMEE